MLNQYIINMNNECTLEQIYYTYIINNLILPSPKHGGLFSILHHGNLYYDNNTKNTNYVQNNLRSANISLS